MKSDGTMDHVVGLRILAHMGSCLPGMNFWPCCPGHCLLMPSLAHCCSLPRIAIRWHWWSQGEASLLSALTILLPLVVVGSLGVEGRSPYGFWDKEGNSHSCLELQFMMCLVADMVDGSQELFICIQSKYQAPTGLETVISWWEGVIYLP